MNIAALDVDGTLYEGTLGFSLLDELRALGLVSAPAVRHVRDTMGDHRSAGDRFRGTTGPASDAYARAMEGVRHTTAVRASHTAWARVRHLLLDSTAPLVENLRRNGFTPVLLSGSPQEMVDRMADEFGIVHRFGMRLATGVNSAYTGRFLSLPAVPEVKAEVLRALAARLGTDLCTALAVGNSASDRALLGAVGHPVAFEPDDALRALARDRGWTVADRHTLVPLVNALTALSPARAVRPSVSPLWRETFMRTPHDIGPRLIERKIDVCFAHADRDQDALIELADVSILFTRILIYVGEPLGSPKALAVHTASQGFCDHMASVTGWASDRRITPEEWREAMAKALAGGMDDYYAYFRPVGESVWAAVDRDDDGVVRFPEFAAFQRAMGTPEANIRLAAGFMGLCGEDAGLPMTDALRAHREFYTSSQAESPGNWLYGDVWADAFWDGTKAKL